MPALEPITARYRLAPHVRGCQVDGQVILLDLRRCQYLGIPGANALALTQVVLDWPMRMAEPPGVPTTDEASAGRCIAALLRRDLLLPATTPAHRVKSADEATESLDSGTAPSAPGWQQLPRLCRAAMGAAWWLNRLSLADIATQVEAMRRRGPAAPRPSDPTELTTAVAAYTRLRPLLFTAHDRCLHDSLSLIRFLAMQKLPADWVIGVRTRPFAAHAWVQHGNLVLNDAHENVRAYTPILVV